MKPLFLLLLSLTIACHQSTHITSVEPTYSVTTVKPLSFGRDIQLFRHKKTQDGNVEFLARIYPLLGLNTEQVYGITKFITFSPLGDTLTTKAVRFNHDIIDYIKVKNGYYAVTTDRNTLHSPTVDYLEKYNLQWQLIHSEELTVSKFPRGNSLIDTTHNGELFLVSDNRKPMRKDDKGMGLSMFRFSPEVRLIAEKDFITPEYCNPTSLLRTSDGNFLITAATSRNERPITQLLKANAKGDIIWQKQLNTQCDGPVIALKDRGFLFYTIDCKFPYEAPLKPYFRIIKFDKNGKIQWQKIIKGPIDVVTGDALETEDGYYLFTGNVQFSENGPVQNIVFELDKKGNRRFTYLFNYNTDPHSRPALITGNGDILLYGLKQDAIDKRTVIISHLKKQTEQER
ncbi:hypothetical protein FW774_19065 [Pedobacter sp. BS3]|uniref:hypothetical protein n=1 Tax=Pedobacter sp. BS3 TaxID=2567937 RepID=UPI0011EBD95E|nr:hypothetical protein [Pedobacter sp. BS3]TZF81156.1 hypothetical protein FW774_19065 [Pedobacter sp. BS3]